MNVAVNRRQVVRGGAAASLAALILGRGFAPGLAQGTDASPEAANDLAALGLPEVVVTVTADSYSLNVTEIPAGRTLFTFENGFSEEIYAAVVQLNEEVTPEIFDLALAGAGENGPPEWYYTLVAPGGAAGAPGSTTHFVVDLPAGNYVVHHDSPGMPFGVAPLTVTGELPADLPAIASAVSIEMVEMMFHLHGEIETGPLTIEVTNGGGQPHFAGFFGVPDGTTIEDFHALSAAFATGNFEGLKLTPEQFGPGFETALQSPGTTMWIDVDLQAGTYLLVCFVPDAETGAPHAMLGMVDLFVIA